MEGSGPGVAAGATGRAERFEDEKRRIIDSCFNKKDTDGSLLESYITHIRIIEDASYPSSPPPLHSNPEVKKPRLIIVAVRKSGRVRMHKARENVNGTFSIGKTWPLDDLTAVESFNGAVPRSLEEEQRKQWAGGVGFIVTIGKPYYWQASTQKEKQFFVASLVKIFTKYTGGKSPELVGFDDREREQLLGITSPIRPLPLNTSVQPSLQTPPTTSPARGQNQIRVPQSKLAGDSNHYQQTNQPRQQTPHDGILRQQGNGGTGLPGLKSQTSRTQLQSRQEAPPSSGIDYPGATPQQNQIGTEKTSLFNRSQESFGSRDDNNSLPPRSRGGFNGLPNAPGRLPERSVTPASLRIGVPENTLVSSKDVTNEVPPVPAPLAFPPERRRPPMPATSESGRQRELSDESMVPAPLVSSSAQRDIPQPSTRSNDKSEVPTMESKSSQNTRVIPTENIPSNDHTDMAEDVISPEIKSDQIASPPLETSSQPREEDRPGLGPMIKSRSRVEVANTFRKMASAATAVNAFKPRAGGAAERLRDQQIKSPDGPDGITGVVPAPALVRAFSSDTQRTQTSEPLTQDKPPTPIISESVPEVKITVPQSRPSSIQAPVERPEDGPSPEKAKPRDAKRQKPASEMTEKYLASIGLDASILDGRGDEFSAQLDHFGWVGEGMRSINVDQMKAEMERELNKAQIGGWLSRFEEEDEKIEAIRKGIDDVLDEVEEYDGLLTLCLVELGTLREDVAYIEAQGQGLQVQAANQKLLQAELQSLLKIISISPEELQSLRESSLESSRGLEQIEKSLVLLFEAMVTIDPSISLSGPRASEDGNAKAAGFGNSEIGSMRVLQEKKETYRTESIMFLRRLKPFLQVKFGAAIDETKKALEREPPGGLNKRTAKAKLDPKHHDLARAFLWKYSPLMLFSREIDRLEWEELTKTYETTIKPVYQKELTDAWGAWKKSAKRATGDEHEILFTSQIEKHTEGLATTARKLTVKRSQTLAKTLRSPLGDAGSRSNVDKSQDGRLHGYEAIANFLDDAVPLIMIEQNFIVDFFHVSSLELQDFPDSVASTSPDYRGGGDLRKPKPMDPNRDLAKRVMQSMEELYSFFPGELQGMIEWALQTDPLQGVGILAAIERKLVDVEETNQEYLARTLQKIHGRLIGLFSKFLEEQIRAIEDTKVKINKRKGVIGFIRIFPAFSAALETMLVTADDLDIRETVNNAYIRVNKTMFESLKVIARENPTATTAGTTMGDPEDKEALNYQILLIENMYYYIEEVDPRNNAVLEDWKEKAAQELDEHLSLYINAVIHRPLGKLLDYLDNVESQILGLGPGGTISSIGSKASFSKLIFKGRLAGHDSKDIRRGIETLKKRVEKHFGDAEDPGLSRGLVAKVLDACEKYYENVEERIETISRDVYEGETSIEWTRGDVTSSFRK